MSRDNRLLALLRHVASSRKVSARRRLEAIDELAALDCLWFTEPTDRLYAAPSKRAVMLIRKYLNQLLKGKAERHRAAVADRLRFLKGYPVEGLYRAVGDPLHPVKEPTTERGGVSSAVAEVLKKLRRDDGTKNNEVSERAGETQAAV
jgi:hypothetical protein